MNDRDVDFGYWINDAKLGAEWAVDLQRDLLDLLHYAPICEKQSHLADRLNVLQVQLAVVRRILRDEGRILERRKGIYVEIYLPDAPQGVPDDAPEMDRLAEAHMALRSPKTPQARA